MSSRSALARGRQKLFLRILAISAGVGAAYGLAVSGGGRGAWTSMAIGLLNGVTIAACIGGIEIFFLRRPSIQRRLGALPFVAVVLLKTLVYGGLVSTYAVLLASLGSWVSGMPAPFTVRGSLLGAVGFSLGVTALFVLIVQATSLVGRRTFRDLILGRYRRPRAERRFFLFVDVVGSTGIAERLGPMKAHEFLAEVFRSTAEPIAAHQGEIYQYVGDEIVVTWTEEEGRPESRPLHCYFDMQAALEVQAGAFQGRFGTAPSLRAALHLGEVIAGEVGEQRRAIVFHGDVMNTASRLEQATRELGARFIASQAALDSLGAPAAVAASFSFRDLGELKLRGREAPIRASAVAAGPAPRDA